MPIQTTPTSSCSPLAARLSTGRAFALPRSITTKSVTAALAGLLLTSTAPPAAATELHPWNEAVPFEFATIHYQVDGSTRGTQTLYVRAHGDERVKMSQTNNPAVPVEAPRASLEISTPRSVIRADLTTKTAVEMPNVLGPLIEGWRALPEAEREAARQRARRIESRFGAIRGKPELAKKSEFLGRPCDVVTIAGVTSTYLAGTTLLLKSEGFQGDFLSRTEATSIDTTTPIPDEVFHLPEGIALRTMNEGLVELTRAQALRELGVSDERKTP